MLALKNYGDVFSLYRSRDQRPVVIEEKRELRLGSEGLWRCVVPVQISATGGGRERGLSVGSYGQVLQC